MRASKRRVVLLTTKGLFSGLFLSLLLSLISGGSVFADKLASHVYYPQTKTIPAAKVVQNRNTPAYRDRVDGMLHSANRPQPVQLVIHKGSLKANVTRFAAMYGWHHVVWKSKHDYNWVAGNTRIYADNLPDALGHLLNKYPVQATFYNGNHILVIIPRNLA